MDDRDRRYFGSSHDDSDKVGFLDEKTRAIFGRSYAAEPDKLIAQLQQDEAIARGGYADADRAEPARRRLQRARHRVHPAACGAAMGWRDK